MNMYDAFKKAKHYMQSRKIRETSYEFAPERMQRLANLFRASLRKYFCAGCSVRKPKLAAKVLRKELAKEEPIRTTNYR